MRSVNLLYSLVCGDNISAIDTQIIDDFLMKLNAFDIPDEQIDNIMEYIDMELLYNVSSGHVRQSLERLFVDLNLRKSELESYQ